MTGSPTGSAFQRRRERITMLLENNPYPQDVRVRSEAESLARAGHSVTVVAPRGAGQPRRESLRGVDVRRFRLPDAGPGTRRGFVLEYLFAAVALHLAAITALVRGATVLHIHNPPDVLFGAGALFRLAGRRVIFDHHDLFPETVEVKFGRGVPYRLACLGQRLTFAVADQVIATNESYAQVAIERGGKRPAQVTVVRNAPPPEWTRLPVHNRDGVLDSVELAYVGAIATQDGVDGIAPVLAKLRDVVGVRLTVIGDGAGRPALEAALERHGVANCVTFTGWVSAERVPELLADADICVDPAPASDVNQRSTMVKIAEYLALGKPVVAYRLLEAERTADGAACLVAPGDVEAFANEIVALARDPARRHTLAHGARRRAVALTWDHSEQALLEAYRRCVSS